MFARITEYNIRPEKMQEIRAYFNDEVLPMLSKQSGFVDTVVLVDEWKAPALGVTITFWKTRHDIDKYERELAPRIVQRLMPYLVDPPRARVHDVEHSTFHRISKDAAA